MPKVSIIVPVYNVEKYVRKCLDSLVNQTLDEIEIILVNDGSTDGSKEILLEYSSLYSSKVKYLEKENGGLSDARNYGLPHATGEYLAFVDSDDYVEPDLYEKMYNKAISEDYDMVECDFIWEYIDKLKIDCGQVYSNKQDMMIWARVVAWNKLIKKSIIDQSNVVFPVGLRYEDIEFFYKLLPKLNKVGFIKEPLIHYIQRSSSISNVQNERTKEILVILQNVLIFYKEKGYYDEYKEALEYTFARILLCSSMLRMVKIKDCTIRDKVLNETWSFLISNFPKWKSNKILKRNKGLKNIYLRTVNSKTFKFYCVLFRIFK